MDCYECGSEMICGGNLSEDHMNGFYMSTNFSCPECNCFIIVYHPTDEN